MVKARSKQTVPCPKCGGKTASLFSRSDLILKREDLEKNKSHLRVGFWCTHCCKVFNMDSVDISTLPPAPIVVTSSRSEMMKEALEIYNKYKRGEIELRIVEKITCPKCKCGPESHTTYKSEKGDVVVCLKCDHR